MKKTMTLKSMAMAIVLATPVFVNAQDAPKTFGKSLTEIRNPENGLIRCISTEYERFLQESSPKRADEAQFESWINNKITERRATKSNQKSGNAVVTIPVVVHIIHNGDALGSNENIRNQQVNSQIRVLNEDYRRKLNSPGYNDILVGADTEIEFCLAQVDPTGEATNGIIRWSFDTPTYNRAAVQSTKSLTQWDPTKYLNIWVFNFGGDLQSVLGYAQFPQGSGLQGLEESGFDFTDGVAIGYQYFGSSTYYPQGNYTAPYDKGRTTTHEIGHFLGLRHIWGDGVNPGCNNTDYCNDTPFAAEANASCIGFIDSCPQPGEDMTNNYMDYTNDTCMNIFTADQKTRMVTVLENSPRRASLLTSGVCGLATTADFQTLQETSVYPNPAQNELNISVADGDLPDSFVIYNTLGQTVANVKVSNQSSLTVNTSAYANGIYIIKIFKGSESKTIKFIKN
ncbi:M43 family zinc metalloprotease [Flavobacterium hauense]